MPTQARTSSARSFFSRHGTLSKWHPKYEYRHGQVEMAEAVESALAEKRHLIVEAGTGTGKTLAYLVPALLSGKRIVVSTGTKNLQEQLFFKDVPFLQQHFARPLKVCYMKGRNVSRWGWRFGTPRPFRRCANRTRRLRVRRRS